MKKYLYIISIVVICLSMFNVTFAATKLKDITGTKYEDAVENLIEIGLVNGYPEDNTYRPSVPVTRAQMAKMMVIALGEEDKVDESSELSSTFTDIKQGHWAYGYVNVAKQLGIINGYPDGRFGPEGTVTYAEATAMALRALGYEDEIEKSTESWPNNYISYGKKLSLFEGVGTFDSNKGGARGDVALILWNMLRTGVCTAISQNDSGIKYGEGTVMLNKYKDYIYEEEAFITKVNFEEDYSKADVTITGEEKITITLEDSDVLDYYGRNIELLYNTKTKSLVYIKDSEKYKEKDGTITELKNTKISIDGSSYVLPDDDNILLYKAEKLADAVEAILFIEDSQVKYVLATGAKKVYLGVVTDNSIKIDDEKGIKIKKLDSNTNMSYVFIDSKESVKNGSIIMYYLNSDEEIGILKEFDVDDAKIISSATSTSIKISSKTYTYNSDEFVVATATSTKVSTMAFKNIDRTKDLAYVFDYAGKTYLIIFEDSVEDESTKTKVLDELKEYISDYTSLEKNEAYYSQDTFARFIKAMETARSMNSNSKIVKINEALTELKTARLSLKSVSTYSVEGKIASYRSKIRALITTGETIVKNKAQYTESSYNAFYTKFVSAKNLLEETDNTQTEVENMYNELNSVMSTSKLIKIVDTQDHKTAVTNLTNAITKFGNADAKENYTTESYNKYKTAKDNAVNAKTNNASISYTKLNEYATKLEEAYKGLELAIETTRNELNNLILDYMVYEDNSGDYMPATYKALQNAMNNAIKYRKSTVLKEVQDALKNLKEAKNGLKKIVDVLASTEKAVKPMSDAKAPKVVVALNMITNNNEDKLNKIYAINSAVKVDLDNLISIAKSQITTATGENLVKLLDATSEAQTASTGAKLESMVSAYVKLDSVIKK